MRELGDCFELKASEVISIVGAGGKTSLLTYLAKYLKGRIIVSASTKMYAPAEQWKTFVNRPVEWHRQDEVVIGAQAVIEDKFSGTNPDAMTLHTGFDYYVIEADGSKGRPLKGWHHNEPVINEATTMTIGIIDMTSVGLKANEDNIFRLKAFSDMTHLGSRVSIDNLMDIIHHDKGLFNKSKGRRLLLLNKVEDQETMKHSEALVDLLRRKSQGLVDGIVIGSIHQGIGEKRRISE